MNKNEINRTIFQKKKKKVKKNYISYYIILLFIVQMMSADFTSSHRGRRSIFWYNFIFEQRSRYHTDHLYLRSVSSTLRSLHGWCSRHFYRFPWTRRMTPRRLDWGPFSTNIKTRLIIVYSLWIVHTKCKYIRYDLYYRCMHTLFIFLSRKQRPEVW